EQVNAFNAVPTPIVGVTPAPTVTGTEGVVLAGVVVAQFTADPTAPANQYEVTINWGDGTLPSAGAAARAPMNPALFNVTGSHTYDSPGTFTITVTVRDAGRTTTRDRKS